jgi:hypothetical protein
LTLRMTVGRDAKGRYVLGKGSALGAETAPAPGALWLAESDPGCAGVGD